MLKDQQVPREIREIPGTAINRYSNTIISPLLENDIIQLCVRTTSNITIEFDGSANAILNLVKIF